jgi:intraflagellar transport protein 81
MKREAILHALNFMLKDLSIHQKRAYLAMYLSIPEIPVEFSNDESKLVINFRY